jgi:hypothetical protein
MLIFHGKVGLAEIEMVSPSLSHELDTGCKAMLHALQPIESLDDQLELQLPVRLQCDKVTPGMQTVWRSLPMSVSSRLRPMIKC